MEEPSVLWKRMLYSQFEELPLVKDWVNANWKELVKQRKLSEDLRAFRRIKVAGIGGDITCKIGFSFFDSYMLNIAMWSGKWLTDFSLFFYSFNHFFKKVL